MNLAEIGQLVQARRLALGLSQARLASMSGLSRATINQLETGSLVDLGAAKLIALLDLVGINLDAGTRKGHKHALQSVSQSASVSYKTLLDPDALAAAMVDGAIPERMTPHIATLLDEVPLSLIVAAVEEVALSSSKPPKLLWKHLFHWAKDLHSPRGVWA
ncbi:MAG: helix-turn-helix transcriptional regulator [Rhodoferax sp.]|uniref:helix-turn-helix domain-containing protein n=1 Tax=Rhodoferax sp. TaxID=50421 RepID=UPI001B4126F7|nr:helix-turn-helix transcriptional regulator [Rhodoferax sp.]MBK7051949.1 helix-turn-helix transcriptional regulator [Rhodoferax sp.]MBP8286295.1 helix-turn-helix transcriptional regulator [Rhodoferax sp.]MBP9736572.1 helix-turn-helix transcriptional regulator [Rhodoferax sp.]